MRDLPAGWPAHADRVKTPPKVYLRLPGSAWPPASRIGDEDLPAGTTRVGSWTIDCRLDAPLLPGQVNAATKMSIASASCTIPQPKGGLLAPWRGGGEAPPKSGACELIASYNGPDGSTAFRLGKFVLDPIKGKLSDPFVSLTMVQDLVRLNKTHDLPTHTGGGFGSPMTGASLLQWAASRNGYAITFTEGTIGLSTSYFPRKTTELAAMQQIVQANLSAMFLSMDGNTIKVLGPGYLLGGGPVVETLDVLTSFEDLSWSQDPGGVADRVEVAYIPPIISNGPLGPAPFNTGSVWTAAKGQGIPPGGTLSFDFDPGSYIGPLAFGGTFQIMANQLSNGSGTESTLNGTIIQRSSGWWSVSIHNPTGSGKFLLLPYDRPAYVDDGVVNVPEDRGWNVPKTTPSFIPGQIDTASESEGAKLVAWGAASEDATNTLRFDFGRNVQSDADAIDRLNHIVGRVNHASYLIEDVNVVPHLGRELGDIDRLLYEHAGLDAKCLVAGIKTSGDSSGVRQSLSLAIPS